MNSEAGLGITAMTQQQLAEKYASLPVEAQRRIDDFVATLSQKYQTSSNIQQPAKSPIEDEAFVGMWRDAPHLENSTGWVRGPRKTHWGRKR